MTRELPDSNSYAESLYRYAASRLDRASLRCWMIQRLMLDDGIEHGCAENIVERVLSQERKAACVPPPRLRRHAGRAAGGLFRSRSSRPRRLASL